MKNMEQLQKAYEKEQRLSEQHKKNAADIKKQMELLQGKNVSQKINSLNMSGAEYDKLMKLLGSGKKTVLEAVELVLRAPMAGTAGQAAESSPAEDTEGNCEEKRGGEESAGREEQQEEP